MDIREISPLYTYWLSEQTDEDEKGRLLMADVDNKSSYLFVKEPYKWEILFQSISREILSGDNDSVRALHILLMTINKDEKEKVIASFERENLFDKSIIRDLQSFSFEDSSKKRKPFRFIKILFAIFTNPYGLVIKREKKHIYEKTGYFINNLISKIT